MDPVLHERGSNGNWHSYQPNYNTWTDTGRPFNKGDSGYVGIRVKDNRKTFPMEQGGGIVN